MEINHFYAADDFTGEQCVLLSDHIASHSYDEAKERELFEAFAIKDAEECGLEPDGMSLNSEGYYLNQNVQCAWFGWKSCAKSRAPSAE